MRRTALRESVECDAVYDAAGRAATLKTKWLDTDPFAMSGVHADGDLHADASGAFTPCRRQPTLPACEAYPGVTSVRGAELMNLFSKVRPLAALACRESWRRTGCASGS